MADLKISELTAAATIAAVDYFVVVQSGVTKKITPITILNNLPSSPVCVESPEILTQGVVSTSINTTIIESVVAADINFTLAAGTHGTEKTIVVSAIQNTFSATLAVSNGIGFSTITFNSVGQTVSLKNISGSWYIMGEKGVAIA